MRLRIGTRGSSLALWQAKHVAARLEDEHPGLRCEFVIIKTRGDKILDTPLARIGGKGLFTKEIEDGLFEGSIDLAVHSLKDLPTELPQGLCIGAVLKREDPRDVLVSNGVFSLGRLNSGARIGTSSLRRRAFLLNRYPQLEIVSIRGNIDTRIRKIDTENIAGVILAAAGIVRMGYGDRIKSFLDPKLFIPAIGQGALAVETRADNAEVLETVSVLNDRLTERCVQVERAFLKRMGGGCQVPMAAYCVPEDRGFRCTAAVVHPDGNPRMEDEYIGESIDSGDGARLADNLIHKGASGILKEVLGKDWKPGNL